MYHLHYVKPKTFLPAELDSPNPDTEPHDSAIEPETSTWTSSALQRLV